MENQWKELYTIADKAIDDSSRLRSLLRELEDRVLKCPLCGRLRDGYGLLGHAADCKLAKELDDESI